MGAYYLGTLESPTTTVRPGLGGRLRMGVHYLGPRSSSRFPFSSFPFSSFEHGKPLQEKTFTRKIYTSQPGQAR